MKSLTRLWASLLIVTYFGTLLLPAVALAATAPFPTCSISINPSVVAPGGSATITWQSTNATGGAITNVGNVGPSGSQQILPPTNAQITLYIGSFTGPGGTANCTASVQINYGTASGSTNTTGVSGGSVSSGLVTPNPIPAVGQTGTPSSQLVQCGTGPGIGNSTSCQACNLAQLVQNIINFMIGLSIPIAAGLFAWAGILYFTAGARPGNIEDAKKIFSNALIGFLICIAAWLIVNTLLHALLDNGQAGFTQGDWFTVQCDVTNRPIDVQINSIINQVLPGVNTAQPPIAQNQGGSAYVCSSGTLSNGSCVDQNNNIIGTPNLVQTYNNNLSCAQYGASGAGINLAGGQCYSGESNTLLGPAAIVNTGGAGAQCNNSNCSPDVLQGLNGDGFDSAAANAMSCIALTENGGKATGCNGVNACGTFQIVVTVNQLNGPDCAKYNGGNPVLNCPAMCKGSNGVATKNGQNSGDPCNPCVQAANDAQCNAESAQNLYAQDGYSPWLSGAAGGSSDNPSALGCVQKYDPTSDSL